MLHRVWLLLAVLSVLVQDSDTECTEKNRRNLSGLVGVGYDVLTDGLKPSVFDWGKFHSRDGYCVTVPEGVSLDDGTFSSVDSFHDCDYTLPKFMDFAVFWERPRFFKDDNARVGSFGNQYAFFLRRFRRAEVCTAICHAHKADFKMSLKPGLNVSSAFKERVGGIARALSDGDRPRAKYRAELLVRDYGTHVIESAYAWAAAITLGQLPKESMRKNSVDVDKLKYAALDQFHKRKNTVVWFETKDGELRELSKGKFSDGNYHKVVEYAPLPIDIRPMNEFAGDLSAGAGGLIKDVIREYFAANIHRGCTSPNAANFNSAAIADDGSCLEFTAFGGFYGDGSTYNPGNVQTTNECGNFEPILVNKAIDEAPPLYWCHSSDAATVDNQRTAFGGFYLRDSRGQHINALTKAKGCPAGYEVYTFTKSLPDISICFDNSQKAALEYHLSRLLVLCDPNVRMNCPSRYDKISLALATGKCILFACVHKGAMVDTSVRDNSEMLRMLPFSVYNDTNDDQRSVENEKEEDLPIAVIVGSAVAVLLCFIIVVVIAFCIVRRAKSSPSLPGAQPPKGSASSTSTGSSSAFNRSKTAPNTARTVQSKTARTVPSNTQATPKKA